MAKAHPGVEILATAIDNLNQKDYLKVWRGKMPYIFMSLLLIWVTAIAMFRNVDRDRVNTLFSSSQIGLLVASYLAMNFTDTYLDFTAPITWAVIYFSVAKIYALANDRVMQRLFTSDVEMGRKGTSILLMPIAIESGEPLSENKVKKFQRRIEQHCRPGTAVQSLKGTQTGIWGLFSDMILVSWTYHGDDATETRLAQEDSAHLAEALKTLPREFGLSDKQYIRYVMHEGSLNMQAQAGISDTKTTLENDLVVGHDLASQWRRLFAQALIKLENKP
jgi:hypothetical protein